MTSPEPHAPPFPMRRQVVRTDAAPPAVGPYSQAVRADGLLHVSCCIGLDPATGRLVGGGIAAQTQRALLNLQAILEAGGSAMDQVLRATVYLTDMADFPTMNEVYATTFGAEPPARTTLAVVALPLTARVGVDAIARVAS